MNQNDNFPKPMLGVNCDEYIDILKYPVYVSPKLDGIRAIIKDNMVYSRNGKPIPNSYTQLLFKHLHGFDGELIVGEPTDKDCFRNTSSGVMSKTGEPNVKYYVFDTWNTSGGIMERYKPIYKSSHNFDTVRIIPQTYIENEQELLLFEDNCLELGYEGVIIRYSDALYKYGRSTLKEGALLKLKRFIDSEAEIIDVIPQYHNANEVKYNALGQIDRSTNQANMIELPLVGAFKVKDIHTGEEFNIGSGLYLEERGRLWERRDTLIGKIIKYKYFPVGMKNKPRMPIYLGFRPKGDMGC